MVNAHEITAEYIFKHPDIQAYIRSGDECLAAIGFTEHGFAHAKRSSNCARNVLTDLGFAQRRCELAAIAGYMHDIGNVINRVDHAHSGALMAFQILRDLHFPPDEVAAIATAIGHHDEKTANPVSDISAALILSDKTDVRRSRVRKHAVIDIDIHDRVNYAVKKSTFDLDIEQKTCNFHLHLDTTICPVMEYFEIFLDRMVLCRKAAQYFDLKFTLFANETRLL